ncbi:MAG: hypothetical protein O7C63_06225 [Alphaproteobacteria bacterium]|nr:hypothetical protein [Alphaproteobacteria bacterium]MCZ6764515.1 hypothetical protein [Alphaproteobacteria bacterium]
MTEEIIDDGIDNYETSERFTDAERMALRYAEWMHKTPEKIDEAFYDALKKHYSTEEIVELASFNAFNIGYHTFFGTLDFYPMFTPDGRLVSQEESRRVYGKKPVSHLKGAVQRAAEAPAEAGRGEQAAE